MTTTNRPTALVGIEEAARIIGYSVRHARIRLMAIPHRKFGLGRTGRRMWLRADVERVKVSK